MAVDVQALSVPEMVLALMLDIAANRPPIYPRMSCPAIVNLERCGGPIVVAAHPGTQDPVAAVCMKCRRSYTAVVTLEQVAA